MHKNTQPGRRETGSAQACPRARRAGGKARMWQDAQVGTTDQRRIDTSVYRPDERGHISSVMNGKVDNALLAVR